MAPAISTTKGRGAWKDLLDGAVLQCVEAATLGMPLEVWKTRMGRFRTEGNFRAFVNVYKRGGLIEYWRGLQPKLVESATKGGVLLYSKEFIIDTTMALGFSETASGFIGGAGGGVSQTIVMAPCTLVVTALVTDTNKDVSVVRKIMDIYRRQGIRGFYGGGTAIAVRQGTNWASRQGFTEIIRNRMKVYFHNDPNAKLSVTQEVTAGIVGGALSVWNQPFEVARIHMQSAVNEGKAAQSVTQVFSQIMRTEGIGALYQGVFPRMCLAAWQTLFMVTGAKLIKEYFPW